MVASQDNCSMNAPSVSGMFNSVDAGGLFEGTESLISGSGVLNPEVLKCITGASTDDKVGWNIRV